MDLNSEFEEDLREALLDDAERRLIGERNNLTSQFIQAVHQRLREYAEDFGYDVDSTIDSLAPVEADRARDRLTVRVAWESEQMARWEFGTSDHEINGNPVLSFVWEENDKRARDPPQWVRDAFEREGDGWRVFFPEVEVRGLPESRAIRSALRQLQQDID